MHEGHELLKALAMVLCVAAITTVLFQRLRQPVVLGYVLAGLIIGPHVPVPLVADVRIVQTLSELGVILLMFALGLEFRLSKLIRIGPTAGVTAIVQCSVMVWLGFMTGRLFGWTTRESLFAGAIIAISSTTIIAKAFDERAVSGKLREIVVGILVVEDLIAVLLMAALTAISSGSGLSAGALGRTTGRLGAFLIGLVAIGLLTVPRAVRAVARLRRPETTLIASMGICFGVALLAQAFGYSVALGAFIAGSLVSESGHEKDIEPVIRPVRDVFGAVFFVSVGMMIDPALVVRHAGAIAVLTAVVVLGKIASVTFGAFLTGNGIRTSVQAGMSLAQIGEFSFIIAGLGLALGATGEFLYPVAVSVSALTTLFTPWLIGASSDAASWVDRRLPRPLQTFAALYGSWIEQLRTAPSARSAAADIRRLLLRLLTDAILLAGIMIGAAIAAPSAAAAAAAALGVGQATARVVILVGAAALSAPFCVGIVGLARRLAVKLADRVLPAPSENRVDLSAAPRRALTVTLQLATVIVVGAPLLAVTQPFYAGVAGAVVLLLLLGVLGVGFWRSATNLQGHVKAGAQVVIEALATAAKGPSTSGHEADAALTDIQQSLPGLGTPTAVTLAPDSPALGKTLAELNLRALSGATVLAIMRGTDGVVIPTAKEVLRSQDVLALAGTHEAIEAAKQLL